MLKILIIAPSWLGDLIMSHALYQILRQQHPDAKITLYAPRYQAPIIARMPEIDRFMENPFGHGSFRLKERIKAGRALRAEHFDRCYVLPNSFKSALVPFFARIPERIGFKGESRYFVLNHLRTNKQDFPRMVERYAALAYSKDQVKSAADLPPIPNPKLQAHPVSPELLKRLGVKTDRPLLALGCGANYGPAKLWPVEYFAAVSSAGIAAGGAVLGLGTKQDAPTVKAIAGHIDKTARPYFYDTAGQTSLTEALDLAALCQGAVCNDSGMMHTVAALDIPQCAIFGSTSTGYTPPLSDKAVCLEAAVACHPCFKRTCSKGTYECLKSLTPEMVLKELAARCPLLQKREL